MQDYYNKQLIILGYSGHSFGIIEAWTEQGGLIKGYVDKTIKDINPYNLKYLGKDDLLNSVKKERVHLSIGDLQIRERIINNLSSRNIFFQTVISKNAFVSDYSKIDQGTYIAKGSMINSLSKIGRNCIINTSAVVEHDVIIGNNTHIGPGAIIAGNVHIGDNVFIGANSVINQNLIIDSNSIIGSGTVVINNVKRNTKVVGNPARII